MLPFSFCGGENNIRSSGTDQYGEEALEITRRATPAKRLGTVDEVARVILFLASDRNDFVTGAVWGVDGGQPLFAKDPRLVAGHNPGDSGTRSSGKRRRPGLTDADLDPEPLYQVHAASLRRRLRCRPLEDVPASPGASVLPRLQSWCRLPLAA